MTTRPFPLQGGPQASPATVGIVVRPGTLLLNGPSWRVPFIETSLGQGDLWVHDSRQSKNATERVDRLMLLRHGSAKRFNLGWRTDAFALTDRVART